MTTSEIKKTNNKFTIPLKLIFSEPGAALLVSQKRRLRKFVMANNKTGYGASFPECDPNFLRKMIFNGYIWKMEFSGGKNGEVQDRKSLIDLTRFVAHTLLFRQFYNSVRKEIFSSDVIRQWNRNNPGKPIDSKTQFNNQFLENFILSNRDNIESISKKILNAVNDYFKINTDLKENEKEKFVELSENFVSLLGANTWFLLSLRQNSEASRNLVENIRRLLVNYLEKTVIAEYLSLLLVELLVFLRPEIFRNTHEVSSGEISICFSFTAKGWHDRDNRVRTDISINDSARLQNNTVQKAISDRTNGSATGLSLKEFYEQAENNIGLAGLGLYYLSYLREVCNKMEILFQSSVSHLPGKETEVNLSMRF